MVRGIIDQLRAITDSQVSLLINQSQVLHGVRPLIPSLHVPSVVNKIADPGCSLSEGGPEGKIKEFNQSNPVLPSAIWANQVSHYNFPCHL